MAAGVGLSTSHSMDSWDRVSLVTALVNLHVFVSPAVQYRQSLVYI